MLVNFEGREWNLDLDDIDVMQARTIFNRTGMTLLKLQEGMDEVNPEALVAVYWLMKVQNGETVDMGKVNFKVVRFGQALIDASKQARADELGITVERLDALREESAARSLKEDRIITVEDLLKESGEGLNPTEKAGAETAPPTT